MVKKQVSDECRIWLSWDKPPLQSAADWLFERYRRDQCWDLANVIVVTPGARSRHRLLELLVERSETANVNWTPPEFVPLHQLPEKLYLPQHAFVDDVAQSAAWARALQELGAKRLAPLARNLPATEGLMDWLPMARLVQALHLELASEALMFDDVARQLERMDVDPAECERWTTLALVQRKYYDQLDALGLWDRQAARVTAIKNGECRSEKDLVLIGLVDLSRVFRRMLEQVAARVRALVFSGGDVREGFDGLGCLRTDFWKVQPIDLDGAELRVVDRPADQATAVIEALTELQGKVPTHEIAIGIPDRSVVPHLRRALDLAGVESHDSAGKSLSLTLPLRLVQAVLDCLRHPHFPQYARLIRHPDCFDWICRRIERTTWLRHVDEFQMEFIPGEFSLSEGFSLAQNAELDALHRAVAALLTPLTGSPRRLRDWGAPWIHFLREIYGPREIDESSDADRETTASCLALQSALRALEKLPADWPLEGSAADAMEIVCQQVGRESLAEPLTANAIELLGWLDLPLDDADVTIVTGLNEGFVPSSENTHVFLPNGVRTQLGIMDNDRRFARDVYALCLMVHSSRRLRLISGRRSDLGDPLLPSRLVFATDDQTMAERASAFFHHHADATSPIWLATDSPRPAKQQFVIPRPRVEELTIASLRVTDFKQFLQCRYRFYLERVLRLNPSVDNFTELPAYAFGRLFHAVVEAFGNDPVKDSEDAGEIRNYFHRQLERAMARYGPHPSPAVSIQHQQVRMRLDRFAELQAERRRVGWTIIAAELPLSPAVFVVDGEPFTVRGQIDRVDRNERTGEIAVFDYKTRDAAVTPEKAHRKNEQWIDLQLPLYRHLIRASDHQITGPIRLGYILAPGEIQKTEFAIADWSEDELRGADEVAHEVIRQVRKKRFWPPVEEPPEYGDLWAAICQDHVSERWVPVEVVE